MQVVLSGDAAARVRREALTRHHDHDVDATAECIGSSDHQDVVARVGHHDRVDEGHELRRRSEKQVLLRETVEHPHDEAVVVRAGLHLLEVHDLGQLAPQDRC